MPSLQWKEDHLIILDQTKLPHGVEYMYCYNYEQVCEAISSMKVRGAPAIGAAAAYGMVLGALHVNTGSSGVLMTYLGEAKAELLKTRPTAVNLSWAVNRVWEAGKKAFKEGLSKDDVVKAIKQEAHLIYSEDIEVNKSIGRWGQKIIPHGTRILTHCNAGALATVDYGTALGVVRAAQEAGKNIRVYADETRPNLQGARLTTWELIRDNIDVTLIADVAAGYLMQRGRIDLVLVGADRIAKNGDVANKIGTYGLAVLARNHNIPFYVAAPLSTFDFQLKNGSEIPIEERGKEELCRIGGMSIAPEEVKVFNPAFDITPAALISGIITEFGIIEGQDLKNTKAWYDKRRTEV